MKNNHSYENKMMNKTEQKTARKVSRLDRLMNSSAAYMANYAVVKGNLPSFNSSPLNI